MLGLAVALAGCDGSAGSASSGPNSGAANGASRAASTQEPQGLTPLSEFDGAIRHVVIHAPEGRIGFAWQAMHDLLKAMPAEVRFTFVCDTAAAQSEMTGRLRQWKFDARKDLDVRLYGRRVSIWSRDRYIAMRADAGGGLPVWLMPDVPPSIDRQRRTADRGVAGLLNSQSQTCRPLDTELVFDGGNVLFDGARVLIGSNVLTENRQPGNAVNVIARLEKLFGPPVVMVPSPTSMPPIRHLDLYMTVIGAGRAVVSSPALGRDAMAAADEASRQALHERLFATQSAGAAGLPDFSEARCALFDGVADALVASGFEVIRMPYADSRGGDFIVGYTNVLQEYRDGRHIVYMPVYQVPALDAAARAAWERLGCEVRPIDVSSMCHLLGAVRCLANVVDRS